MEGRPRPRTPVPSPAQCVGVEPVAFRVAPAVPPQAQRQAAVALTGQVGAVGVLPCGMRGARDEPRLWGR